MATKVKEKEVAKATGKGKSVTKSDARATQVRAKIQDLRSSIEENYLELAESLHEVHSKEYFLEYGFKTFAEYAEVELETKYRRAMYFVDIWNRTKDLKIAKSKLKKIGWTKAKEIVGAMTEDNADELIDLAAEKTSTELKEEMIKRKDHPTAGTRGAAERLSYQRMSLKMSTSEADVITSAMEEAKKAIDSDNDVAALEHICMEWMQQNDEASPPSLDSVIKYASTVFGVTLVETGKKSKAKVAEKEAPKAKEKVKAKKEPEPAPDDEIDLDEITSWSSATKFCKERGIDLKFSRTDTVKKMKAAIEKALEEGGEEDGDSDDDDAPPPKASKKVEKKTPAKAAPKKTAKKEEPDDDGEDADDDGEDSEDINKLLGIQ